MNIPKIIHQIWLGDQPIPDELQAYSDTWRLYHSGWEYRLWTDANLPAMSNRALFESCPAGAHRADVLRYELMLQFGGVYADMDFECRKPLDPLLGQTNAFLGRIATRRVELGSQHIENAILGSVPGHPFFAQLVRELPDWLNWWWWHPSVPLRTGPQYVEMQLNRWLARHRQLPLTLFAQDLFYPYMWDEPERKGEPFPNSYAVHHWMGTWRQQDRIVRPAPIQPPQT